MASVTAGIIAGGLSAAGSVASAEISSSAAQNAAKTQAAAANNAAALQFNELGTITQNLAPFAQGGVTSLTALQNLTGTAPGGNPLAPGMITAPFTPGDLTKTPGYQFTLGQGLEATRNSFASQGLGQSGAATKGAVNYAEGLASTTYNQQLQNYLAQNAQTFNMLYPQTTLGESAAAQTGQLGTQNTALANNFATSGAAATAAGQIGSANALTAGITGVTNAASNTALLLALNNSGMFGNPAGNSLGGTTPTITGANPVVSYPSNNALLGYGP